MLVGGAALLVALPALSAATRPSASREASEGARFVVYELSLLKSTSAAKSREQCGGHCNYGGGSVEVTIGLLGLGGSASTQSLLNLLSIKLDGGGAEERECQIAKRGRSLVPALKAFNAADASSWCTETFNDLRKQELSGLHDVSVEQICKPAAEVEMERKQWIAALQSGRDLFAESGPC